MKNTVTAPGEVIVTSTDPAVGRPMYRNIVITVYGDHPVEVSWGGVQFELQGGDTVGLSNQRIRSAVSVANVAGQTPFERVTIGAW